MSDNKNISKIIEMLEGLSVSEALTLVKTCEEKWGVSAAAPVAVASAGAAAEAVEEKTQFEVLLKAAGAKKVEVMKVVREITKKGLVEAKKIVEDASDATPSSLGAEYSKEDAEKIKKQLADAGATVEIK